MEQMEQKPMSIHEFKKGDKITRIQPSKSIAKIGEDEIVDRNFIGIPFIFIGIANGCIYLKRIIDEHTKELMSGFLNIFGDISNEATSLKNIELDLFENGWSYYIDPMTLGGEKNKSSISIKDLKKKLDIALKTENYKEADKLQKQIQILKNNE